MKSSQFLSEDLISDASEAQQDHEVQMARKDCFHAAEDAVAIHRLLRSVSENEGLEGWVQSKITLAHDYLNKVREHLEYKMIGQEAEITIGGDSVEPKLPIAETTTAGAVATVNNPKSKKKSAEVGSLFGGSYKQKVSENVDIPGTEGKSDEERHKAIMKKYPNAKKVGKTPGAYSTTGKGKADLISGVRGVRKISKD